MRALPYIEDLSRAVLEKSTALQGRFFVCPKSGFELNYDELGKLIEDLVRPAKLAKKYPLALQMPPVVVAVGSKNDPWALVRIVDFFLNTTYYSGTSQTMSPNSATRTSTHRISDDWHDMMRCAVNFYRVLETVQRSLGLIQSKFRLDQSRPPVITPVSEIGADRASGVRMEFYAHVFLGCEIEDYTEEDISAIEAPADDSHPQHQL